MFPSAVFVADAETLDADCLTRSHAAATLADGDTVAPDEAVIFADAATDAAGWITLGWPLAIYPADAETDAEATTVADASFTVPS